MVFNKPNVFFASFYLAFNHLKKFLPKSGRILCLVTSSLLGLLLIVFHHHYSHLLLMFIPILEAFKMTAYALMIALGINSIRGESFVFYSLKSLKPLTAAESSSMLSCQPDLTVSTESNLRI